MRTRAPGQHVGGEGGQLGKALFHPAGDKGARPLLSGQKPLAHQTVDRLADCDSGDGQLGGYVALGRKRVVGAENLRLYRLTQGALQLLVKRLRMIGVKRTNKLN